MRNIGTLEYQISLARCYFFSQFWSSATISDPQLLFILLDFRTCATIIGYRHFYLFFVARRPRCVVVRQRSPQLSPFSCECTRFCGSSMANRRQYRPFSLALKEFRMYSRHFATNAARVYSDCSKNRARDSS